MKLVGPYDSELLYISRSITSEKVISKIDSLVDLGFYYFLHTRIEEDASIIMTGFVICGDINHLAWFYKLLKFDRLLE